MVIEERLKDANRNGASTALRPRTPRRRDGMRAARRGSDGGISSIAQDRFGMNLDRRAPWPRPAPSCAVSRCAPRGRSSIITAHAKMQFKLQVHVISRARWGKRFRPARRGGRRSAVGFEWSNQTYTLLLRPRHGNARSAHRYIHHDSVALHKRMRKCAPVAGEKGNATFVTRALRHSRKHKQKIVFSPNLLSAIIRATTSCVLNEFYCVNTRTRAVYRSDQKSMLIPRFIAKERRV